MSKFVIQIEGEAMLLNKVIFTKRPVIESHKKFATLKSVVSRVGRIDTYLRIATSLLIGLMMNAFIPVNANAADHIKVTREFFLENNAVKAITRTHDGGYVIAGYSTATRVDTSGKVIWRYASKKLKSDFHSVTTLPDDSVILCGESEAEKTPGHGLRTFGLLTRVDKTGTVVSDNLISPNDNQNHSLNSLNRCFPFEDGVAILGNTSAPVWGNPGFDWLVMLDDKGIQKSEKLSHDIGFEKILTMSDHSFVTHTHTALAGSFIANRVSRVDSSSTVKATRIISDWSFPVQAVVGDRAIRLLTGDRMGIKSLEILNDKLETSNQTKLSVDLIAPIRAYALPDRSMMLFGSEASGNNSSTASMEWISPDLAHNESYIFEPRYSSEICDVIPTGTQGEFVVVRRVWPFHNFLNVFGAEEKREGIVLTFVQVK